MIKGLFMWMFLCVFAFLTAGCCVRNNAVKQENSVSRVSPATAGISPLIPALTQEDSMEFDFGEVKAGQVMKHEFNFVNNTEAPMTITNLHTSCGCTASEIKNKSLAMGESTTIAVTFNSTGYSGPVQQFVYVNTDRKDFPIAKFTIKANVVK